MRIEERGFWGTYFVLLDDDEREVVRSGRRANLERLMEALQKHQETRVSDSGGLMDWLLS